MELLVEAGVVVVACGGGGIPVSHDDQGVYAGLEAVVDKDHSAALLATEIAADRLLWGTPEDVIGQIERYRRETGCGHVHAAFGAGMPAREDEYSTLGRFEEQAEMIRLFGREVIPAFRS